MKPLVIIVAGLSSLLFGAAFACSPDLSVMNSVSRSYDAANVVALAYLESSNKRLITNGDYKGATVEAARFLVLEVWKGPFVSGAYIETTTTIWNGNCGISAQNDPAWIESVDGPLAISRTWLLYLDGDVPYGLRIGRSKPIDVGGAQDLPELYKLTNPRGRLQNPAGVH